MDAINPVIYTDNSVTAAVKTAAESGSDISFADLLTQAMDAEVRDKGIQLTGQTGGGLAGAVSPFSQSSGGSIEALMIAAASSGKVDDTQVALFMLMQMMQTEGGSDFAPIMSLMSTLVGQLSSSDQGGLYGDMSNSGYDAYTKGQIDTRVFGAALPNVTGSGTPELPEAIWKPTTPARINIEGSRSPEALRAVVDQFDVENSIRYKPYRHGDDTYCNIYVWDVTSALGAEIPHYIDPKTGAPMKYPDVKGANEQGAIAMERWLVNYGPSYGWREVDPETAQAYANSGRVAVTTAGDIGHTQMIVPNKNGFDPIRGVAIAQAGSHLYNDAFISNVYGSNGLKQVRYFVHN